MWPTREGLTPAHFICSIDLVETFFNINDEENQTIQINARNIEGYTPLHSHLRMTSDQKKAVIERKHERVQEDAQDNEEPSLHLILDMMNGCKKTAEALLRRGADPNIVTDKGQTCLHTICWSDDDVEENMAKMLFEICDEKHQIVEVDARDNEGWTPLHVAIRNGNINLMKFLLTRGAAPNSVTDEGESCLHIICRSDDDDDNMAKLFFEICDKKHQMVQVDARDNDGRTPLHVSIRNGNINLMKFLLTRGANPNLANENGFTTLHIACQRKYDDVDLLKMLFEAADKFNKPLQVDARDKSDCTPLHLALNCGHEQIAEWLLRKGADLNLANAKGSTPLHLISAGKMDYVDLLKAFFEISDEQTRPPVKVDARDNEGKRLSTML
ncbi:unnamed protein product [Trichogramma brassicae]|uniref:Uncharacterized protein n=1 Tax=Trichogramma brassicae TaxID=86971 RepID=A0A6H5IAH4_9HYME|nr:unnamed protein product [Trichogramma brassicae]